MGTTDRPDLRTVAAGAVRVVLLTRLWERSESGVGGERRRLQAQTDANGRVRVRMEKKMENGD